MGLETIRDLILGALGIRAGDALKYGKIDAHEVLAACTPEGSPEEPVTVVSVPALNKPRTTRLSDFASFSGPLIKIPRTRVEVYEIYGRPVEGWDRSVPDSLLKKKAVMKTIDGLPGSWNKGRTRLYMLKAMAPYLTEALLRADRFGDKGLDYIERMGCYNFRHARFDKDMPLSYHSWGAAVDINSDDNVPAYSKVAPIPPPFSSAWLKKYPHGVPYELVLCFMSVGFAWGGCWGSLRWMETVAEHGVGYDQKLVDEKAWRAVTYTDPMHFELINRK